MNLYPLNPNAGQKIQSAIPGNPNDHAFLSHFQVSAAAAVAASNVGVHAAVTLSSDAQEIKTGITNPAVPRNIVVKGNASGITGNVVITGTNYLDEEITETIALSGSSAVAGNKAFKTVTQIDLPIQTHEGTDTVSIGWGSKLGLKDKLAYDTVILAAVDNAREATLPTVATSATAIESNTVTLNTALNGKVVDVYYIV